MHAQLGRVARRFGVVTGLVTVLLGVSLGSPAAAQGYEEIGVSGPFTAVGQLRTDNCMLFHQIVDGGGEWTGLGTSTFHLDFCLEERPGSAHFPISNGSFDITAPEGTLTGELTGTVEAGGFPPPDVAFPLHMVLTITDGTGRFTGAAGELRLEGAFGYGAATAWGDVYGTVLVPLPMPTSSDDCRNGGWRSLYDDEGEPFRNQGQCVAWAIHNT